MLSENTRVQKTHAHSHVRAHTVYGYGKHLAAARVQVPDEFYGAG